MSVCAQDEIERQGSVLVDYVDLTGDKTVREALPDLTTVLKEQPEVILNCLGVAIHQVHAQVATSFSLTEQIHTMYVHSLLNTRNPFDE